MCLGRMRRVGRVCEIYSIAAWLHTLIRCPRVPTTRLVFPIVLSLASFVAAAEPTTQPSLFREAETGDFDVSGFLSSKQGFLPIAVPITEPAVGYGLSLGLSFFHDKPKV